MNFDEAFDRTVGFEGGYTDGKGDPGGETKWGISKHEYPNVNIKTLSREGAKAIYLKDFWTPLIRLPGAVMYQLFDFAVNSGIGTAIRSLQRAVGVADDGRWGPVSRGAALRMVETDIVMRLNAERLDFITRLNNWPTAGKGWVRRVAQNLRYASEDI